MINWRLFSHKFFRKLEMLVWSSSAPVFFLTKCELFFVEGLVLFLSTSFSAHFHLVQKSLNTKIIILLALEINIIPLLVTMNTKIKKALVKLNFPRSQWNNKYSYSYDILCVIAFNVLVPVLPLNSVIYNISCLVKWHTPTYIYTHMYISSRTTSICFLCNNR